MVIAPIGEIVGTAIGVWVKAASQSLTTAPPQQMAVSGEGNNPGSDCIFSSGDRHYIVAINIHAPAIIWICCRPRQCRDIFQRCSHQDQMPRMVLFDPEYRQLSGPGRP